MRDGQPAWILLAAWGSVTRYLNCSGRLTNGSTVGQLSGAIPDTIGLLTALTALDLGYNKLQGPIPVNITQLTNLVYAHCG